jgi:acyl-CoA synthetase (AMP-forming)/AMP-acid ligase II
VAADLLRRPEDGRVAVPLNFRYTAEEIKYCLNLAEADV